MDDENENENADNIFNRIKDKRIFSGLCDAISVNLLSQGNSSVKTLTK